MSYYKNRINFEVFHALTDGTGAMHFLMELVKNYLQETHPSAELPELFPDENITGRDMEEDSFSQYYSSDAPRKRESKKPAFQLKGEKLRQEDMSITEVCIPVKEIHARAKAAGVSITVFLTAALIWRSMKKCLRIRRKAHWSDDPGKSEKLFSIPVYGKFFRMD